MVGALNLNPDERRALKHGEGQLLVIAGPGSGKAEADEDRVGQLGAKGLLGNNSVIFAA